MKRTSRGTRGVGNFYPPEGLFEPMVLTADVQASVDDRLTVMLVPLTRSETSTNTQAALAEVGYLQLLETAELEKAS